MKLEQCGIEPAARFSFYDQVHTTGMDIPQPLAACAALTLGKDMSWRDYAQGAFRMRGLGAGQRIELLMTPEVERLVDDAILGARRTGATRRRTATRCASCARGYPPAARRRQGEALAVDLAGEAEGESGRPVQPRGAGAGGSRATTTTTRRRPTTSRRGCSSTRWRRRRCSSTCCASSRSPTCGGRRATSSCSASSRRTRGGA